MKINLYIFVSSLKNNHKNEVLQKSYQSDFRPMIGDIVDDPGFHPQYHNGYEIVKVTINYHTNECYVSLHPLAIELEEIEWEMYIERLIANGWQVISKEKWKSFQ